MPSKAPTPCTRCGARAIKFGLCATHSRQRDHQRGTAAQRGYSDDGHQSFRQAVCDRDGWTCVVCGGPGDVADHWPHSRRELIAMGEDPNDPRHGRCLCKRDHDQHTASTQGLGPRRRQNLL